MSENKWIPHQPTFKQAFFLALQDVEAFYGGAAGGGKSEALLMCAAQWLHEPNYTALLLRKTYPDLALPGAPIDRSLPSLLACGSGLFP